MRFGKLTLPKELPKRNRSRYWLCQCDCGNQCEVAEKHLNENGTKSCGCLSRRAEPHTIGMRFGKLTLLEELPKRNGGRYWLCRCDCGNQCEVAAKHLNENGTKSCGCLFDELAAEKQTDLTGRRFGRLTVLERLYRRGNHTYWRCRCDCGQEIKASLTNLYHGYVMSCGCLHAEQAKINMRNNIHFVQDTCVEKIACQREMVTNTSGHRGVRQVESGNWRAFLTFQKKRHNLGTYKTFEEAVAARLEGEEIYFKTFLDNYYAKQKA